MSQFNLHHAEQLMRFTPGKSYTASLIFWMLIGNLPLLMLVFFLYDALASTFLRAPTAVFAFAISLIWLIASYFIIAMLLEPIKYMSTLLQEHNRSKRIPDIQFTTQHQAGIMINNLHSLIDREKLLRSWLNDLTPEEHLTGFYSGNWMEARLEEDLDRARRDNGNLSLLLLEVCNFSAIREQAGLTVANHCLLTLAQLAESSTRKGDWLSRWTDNRILMVLWNDQDQAAKIGQRILDNFKSVKFLDESDATIHVVTRIIHSPYNHNDTTKIALAKIQTCLDQNSTVDGKVITCDEDILRSRI